MKFPKLPEINFRRPKFPTVKWRRPKFKNINKLDIGIDIPDLVKKVKNITEVMRDNVKSVKKVKKVIKPKEWTQILIINLATLTALSGGILFALPSPSEATDDDPVNVSQWGTNAAVTITAILTSPIYSYLLDSYGRKRTLLLATLPQILAGLLVNIDSEPLYFFTRILSAVGDGLLYVALPTFIGEVATPKVRETWGNSMAVNMYLGTSILNGVEMIFKISIASYVLVMLPVFVLMLFACFPDTPHYYLMRGKPRRARTALKFLRCTKTVETELAEISEDVRQQRAERGEFRDILTRPHNRKSLGIAVATRACQQFCGITALAIYTQEILRETFPEIPRDVSTLIYSGLLAVSNLTAAFFLERIGRRRAMYISCLGCSVFLSIVSLYYYVETETGLDTSYVYWMPMCGLVFFIPFYALGLGIIPTLILGELFAFSIKARALCVTNVIFTMLVTGTDLLFHYLFSNYGVYMPFAVYSVCCFFSAILNFFVLPENEGKTLGEIQQRMKKGVKDVMLTKIKSIVVF